MNYLQQNENSERSYTEDRELIQFDDTRLIQPSLPNNFNEEYELDTLSFDDPNKFAVDNSLLRRFSGGKDPEKLSKYELDDIQNNAEKLIDIVQQLKNKNQTDKTLSRNMNDESSN